MALPFDTQTLPRIITAIGALGTAAFGLVDATKVLPFGGVNRIGFKRISKAVSQLTPRGHHAAGAATNALPQANVLGTLKANWYNGVDLSSQKAAAKSLIKLNLNPGNAGEVARAAGVSPETLTTVASKIATATALTTGESDVYARFDFILTALLDEAYQYADQQYTNGTRTWAMLFSLILAFAGTFIVSHGSFDRLSATEALMVGLLATPLAPICKNLSSALATAVSTMQALKK